MEHESFRDHLSTVTQEGKRIWVYPKRQKGRFYTARTVFSFFLLAFLFLTPWIKIDSHPFMLFNVFERKFIVLGLAFGPQDFYIFALGFVTLVVFVVLFTAVFGRIFCGWACPQTVFMEMVFRKIEYFIEGDAAQQRFLDKAPFDSSKLLKKGLKHFIFFGIALLIGNTFMAYIVGIDETLHMVSFPPTDHLTGFVSVIVFSLIFYFVFSKFREQACTIVCPYGRLQGVLLDPNTVVVAYDNVRGEPRGRTEKATPEKNGDCIDCHLCVAVCPTGIDIRNGTQLECVNCTSCIDACDSIMDKVEKPRGLIRYASMKGIKDKVKFKVTPRIILYSVLLVILLSIFTTLLLSREDVKVNVLRAPGKLFQEMPEGKISNLYHVKLVNNTFGDIPVEVKINNPDAEFKLIGKDISLPSLDVRDAEFMILFSKDKIKSTVMQLNIQIYANGKIVNDIKTTFIGPPKN
ncbi:MAG: cytochrome c oxidase accessory protein CcoG [Ignavibacteriota bacterium]|nr:cytochrome c oxidase accessory protein CcoG [Ignavibacteriota bacterium]